MREIRPSGSEGGARSIPCPYPYRGFGFPSHRQLGDAPLQIPARNPCLPTLGLESNLYIAWAKTCLAETR